MSGKCAQIDICDFLQPCMLAHSCIASKPPQEQPQTGSCPWNTFTVKTSQLDQNFWVSPITVVSRQKLEVDLQLGVAISQRRSEPVQGVGGDRVEGGGEGDLRGGAGGQENPALAHDRHVEVVGQGDLEAFL